MFGLVWSVAIVGPLLIADRPLVAAGTLTLEAKEEATDAPVITRLELLQGTADGRGVTPRRTVSAGVGVVLDRSVDLTLRDGSYHFRMVRGPEYRIVSGDFMLQRDSLDQHTVRLPRMVDMLQLGWTSGDCLVPPSPGNLTLRMAAEDLHLATTLGPVEWSPIPGRKPGEPIGHEPAWIVSEADHLRGLLFVGAEVEPPATGATATGTTATGTTATGTTATGTIATGTTATGTIETGPMGTDRIPVERLASIDPQSTGIRVAVENPFAWPLPVWLASGRVSGVFILGDWLQPNRKILGVEDGREPEHLGPRDEKTVGYLAEQIYWNLLEAGFQLPPLAGSGSAGTLTPVGYNRLYVAQPLADYEADGDLEAARVTSPQQWWEAAWSGHSVATNGPLLRPRLGGQLPGHRFLARDGEKLELRVELALSVRDPVRYLEVIHNGRVHYSARLDEFAAAGGEIPELIAEESGWVLVRVVTEYPDHFRAAISAPWYIEFEGRPRVTVTAVDFFRRWLADYEQRLKQLPSRELARHVPYVRAARAFWTERAMLAEASASANAVPER